VRAVGLVAAILGWLLFAATAAAQDPVPGVRYDALGDPELFLSSPGAWPVHWERCAGVVCTPLPAAAYVPGDPRLTARPGETAPATVFEAVPEGGGTIARVPPWTGRLTATAAPVLTGSPIVGAIVDAQPATWSGGWEGASNVRRTVVACTGPQGGECWTLDENNAVVSERWLGWYLFAVEARLLDPDFAPHAYPEPQPSGPLAGAAAVAVSAPSGPVAFPPAPPPRATARLRKKALHTRAGLVVGSVRCPQRCRVRLTVADGRRNEKRTFSFAGTKTLSVPGKHLHRRPLKVWVEVDGRIVASGKVR
jgi:hypothetical protein